MKHTPNMSQELALDVEEAKKRGRNLKGKIQVITLKTMIWEDALWYIHFSRAGATPEAEEKRFQRILTRIPQCVCEAASVNERFAHVMFLENADLDRALYQKEVDDSEDGVEKNRASRTLKPQHLRGAGERILRLCFDAHIKPRVVPDDWEDGDYEFDTSSLSKGRFRVVIQY